LSAVGEEADQAQRAIVEVLGLIGTNPGIRQTAESPKRYSGIS